jgi:hypothetical protein
MSSLNLLVYSLTPVFKATILMKPVGYCKPFSPVFGQRIAIDETV